MKVLGSDCPPSFIVLCGFIWHYHTGVTRLLLYSCWQKAAGFVYLFVGIFDYLFVYLFIYTGSTALPRAAPWAVTGVMLPECPLGKKRPH